MSRFKFFSDSDIMKATNDLSESSQIGKGGFGVVYKGTIADVEVAIKILDPKSTQGENEFVQEMAVLKGMKHENLVKLMGACLDLRSLVYEYVPNGSLEDCLKNNPGLLTWKIRIRIVCEICSALNFLHSRKPKPLVHGDLKPHNILLDANLQCKLADFGLSRFLPEVSENNSAFLVTKNINGTEWYIDPDFLDSGKLTPSSDVYSLGVTILRILTGQMPHYLCRKVRKAYKSKLLMEMVDATAGDWPVDIAEYLANYGMSCCKDSKESLKLMMQVSTYLKEYLGSKQGELEEDTKRSIVSNTELKMLNQIATVKDDGTAEVQVPSNIESDLFVAGSEDAFGKLKLLNRIAIVKDDGTVEFQVPSNIEPVPFVVGCEDVNGEAVDDEPLESTDIQYLPPLQIVILIVGTRGDIQPFVAIGKRLQDYGHRVRLASHANFKEFVFTAGLEFYPLGGDPKVLAKYMVNNKGFLPSAPSEIRNQIKEIIFSLLPACKEPDLGSGIPFRADAIIANPQAYGQTHVAEALRVPIHIFSTMPWTPTSEFPHPLSPIKQPAGYRVFGGILRRGEGHSEIIL